ncbi:hypothetical protein CI102_10538 [Trichoderma harzianum]|nr:hypothetical protein CI102_10538 [Trichoderma harzianum]
MYGVLYQDLGFVGNEGETLRLRFQAGHFPSTSSQRVQSNCSWVAQNPNLSLLEMPIFPPPHSLAQRGATHCDPSEVQRTRELVQRGYRKDENPRSQPWKGVRAEDVIRKKRENENHPKTGFRSANHLASSPPHFSPLSAPLSLLPFFSLPDLAAQREHESTRLAGEV